MQPFGNVARTSGKLSGRSEQVLATRAERASSGLLNMPKSSAGAQNDLEKLLLVSVRIAKQTNLFQKFWSQQMSFVTRGAGAAFLWVSRSMRWSARETRWLARRCAGNSIP